MCQIAPTTVQNCARYDLSNDDAVVCSRCDSNYYIHFSDDGNDQYCCSSDEFYLNGKCESI